MGPDDFRTLDAVTEPDERWQLFVRLDPTTGTSRKLSLADHHAALAQLSLPEHVPVEIRVQFDVARNLLVYSWFVYRFLPIGQMACCIAIETALRRALGYADPRRAPRLKRLLAEARTSKLLTERLYREWGFGHDDGHDPAMPPIHERIEWLIAEWRNMQAHGDVQLWPQLEAFPRLAAATVAGLFPPPGA